MNAAEILEEFVEAAALGPIRDDDMMKSKGFLIRGGARKAPKLRDFQTRFMSQVKVQSNGCHLWTGATMRFHVEGRGKGAAIAVRMAAWEIAYGTRPKTRLYPSCREGRCVNVEHLTDHMPKLIGESRFRMTNPAEDRKRTARPAKVAPIIVETIGSSTTAGALASILHRLDELGDVGRARVLRAIVAYYAKESE